MDNPVKICFCTGSRSERGLVEPLLRRLYVNPKFKLHVLELPTAFIAPGAYLATSEYLALKTLSLKKVDLAFCSFDRVEMLGVALAFFFNNVPIAQLHAGDISMEGSFDDYVRHMITLCSTFQFCNSLDSYRRTIQLLKTVGKSTDHCHNVGSIQFDDMVIDYSVVPDEPFDLIVYNTPTRCLDLIPKELDEIEALLDKYTIWIEPNEDSGRELIVEMIRNLEEKGKVHGFKSLPRSQYFALLEKSERCIGNSSSFFLELPYFKKEHIHIGVRNRGREKAEVRPGGSDRIIRILEEIYDGGQMER